MKLEMRMLSPLEKVFLDKEPAGAMEEDALEGFENETVSFQAAYCLREGPGSVWVVPSVRSPIADCIRVRSVRHVPVRYACMPDSDSDYLRKTPGLYPDLLRDIAPHSLRAYSGQWDSLWVDVEGAVPGTYPVEIGLCEEDSGQELAGVSARVTVLPGDLPPQTLRLTRWFHYDALAHYYHVPVFSEDFWEITEKFVRLAVKRGVNMLLTPVHTPPLDTRVGGERLTVQLVDVCVDGGRYSFGFERLNRFVDMALRCGIEYLEIAHLFTQWGAGAAPKIMARVDGREKQIFGWDTPSDSPEYAQFLTAYLPALRGALREKGVEDRCVFHLSDEPGEAHLAHYLKVKEMVRPYLQGCTVMDALSDVRFYRSGAVEHPVPALDHMEAFVEAGVKDLWTYYCLAQYRDVSNMFMSMPSRRNRILGAQLFRYDIRGFLHWGYNFYGTQYSDDQVDPYAVTDGDGFSPAGDCFQVYPGRNGEPEESIRLMVTFHALQDLRAMRWLEALAGRENVLKLMEEDLAEPLTFRNYPRDDRYLLQLRKKLNRAILAWTAETQQNT